MRVWTVIPRPTAGAVVLPGSVPSALLPGTCGSVGGGGGGSRLLSGALTPSSEGAFGGGVTGVGAAGLGTAGMGISGMTMRGTEVGAR